MIRASSFPAEECAPGTKERGRTGEEARAEQEKRTAEAEGRVTEAEGCAGDTEPRAADARPDTSPAGKRGTRTDPSPAPADGVAACPDADSVRLPQPGAAGRIRRGIAIALLVLIPAGYLAISAVQSHNEAAARELNAEQAGLVNGLPSPVQLAVYRVPVPDQAGGVAFFEANSWSTDTLYVQFTTTQDGLAGFLRQLGATPGDLQAGLRAVTVPTAQAAQVPWAFTGDHRWAGLALTSREPHPPHPAYAITVDLDDPASPAVFVTSTVRFAR